MQTNDPACTELACNIESVCEIMMNATLGQPLQRLIKVNQVRNSSFALSLSLTTPLFFQIVFGPQCLDVSYKNSMDALLNTTIEGGHNRIWFYQTCLRHELNP